MKDYYADFVKEKNIVNTSECEVSKVSKGQENVKKYAFDTFDTSISKSFQENEISKGAKSALLANILNQFHKKGVQFEIGLNDLWIHNRSKLTDKELRYIKVNTAEILCTFQQSILVRNLTNEYLESFIFEVSERLSLGGEYFPTIERITLDYYENVLSGNLEENENNKRKVNETKS